MISILGLALLVLAALCALGALLSGLRRTPAPRLLRACQIGTPAATLAAFSLLAALMARGDRSLAYAVSNAAPSGAGLGYRLGAVWAGQGGGLLLWCLETALVALALSPRRQPRALGLLSAVLACLLTLGVLNNPFAPAPPGQAGGLNPLLQGPMMLIHPPMLFLGYALLAVPFALTLGALWEGDLRRWAGEVRPWLLVSALALTAGNGFGAAWAYRTFGWGGFWSWDPVEDTSFVPWVLSLAALHALVLGRGESRYLRSSALCAAGAFLAVIYGSFLARSGLLAGASVHAYVAGEKLFVWALGSLLAGGTVLSAVLFLRRDARRETRAASAPHASEGGENGSDTGLEACGAPSESPPATVPAAWGLRLLVGLAAVVLAGMSLPLIKLAPGTTVYDTVALPFGAGLMLMLAWPRHWRPANAEAWARGIITALAGLLVIGAGAGLLLPRREGTGSLAPAAVGLLLAPVLGLAALAALGPALRGVFFTRRPWRERGAAVAHCGVALLLLGALISGYGALSQNAFVPLGLATTLHGMPAQVIALTQPTPQTTRAEVELGADRGTVELEKSSAFVEPLRHGWVLRRVWGDLYVTPMALLPTPIMENGEAMPAGAMLEVTVKPAMGLVWAGIWLIAAGLALALGRRQRTPPRALRARTSPK